MAGRTGTSSASFAESASMRPEKLKGVLRTALVVKIWDVIFLLLCEGPCVDIFSSVIAVTRTSKGTAVPTSIENDKLRTSVIHEKQKNAQ